MTARLPYGSWPSPIHAADVAAASPRFDGADFVDDEIWWAESVAADGGRMAVHRRLADGTREIVLPAPWNARSAVHEYGGGAWAACDGELYFSERSDGRVYALRPGGTPRALTPVDPEARYGGLRVEHGQLLAVSERHPAAGGRPRRAIVVIPRDGTAPGGGGVRVLADGTDFVAQPALSSDGSRVAWVSWRHPAMPWDRTRVLVAPVDGTAAPVAITDGTTAALQPTWAGDDLLFVDDPTGRWNLYSWRDGVRALAPAEADTGGALWVLGTRWFADAGARGIVAARTDGADAVVLVSPDGSSTPLDVPITSGAVVAAARDGRALVFGADPERPTGLWLVDLDGGPAELVAGGTSPWGAEWMPRPVPVTADGPRGPVHAIAYPPHHPGIEASSDETPPYVVLVHGGPTSHVGPAASGAVAYLTSRGIGVLDVNYGGSTGYGRAYRERLRGAWGIVDVEDVAEAARALAEAGLADPSRIAIKGSSAGGWTVLSALADTDVFAAGISRYGVGDARALAADTHDFEAHYLDGLIGPLPEAEAEYVRRSPLSRADRFRVPILILQGSDDAVVPPSQAEAIRHALAARGIPHAMVVYDGEGHGFRRPETTADVLEKELGFLSAVFGFRADGIAPLTLA